MGELREEIILTQNRKELHKNEITANKAETTKDSRINQQVCGGKQRKEERRKRKRKEKRRD
jgi:hypothetical protein